ncbi:MAG: phage protein Gp27 family protein [Sandaracinobacter sp.]
MARKKPEGVHRPSTIDRLDPEFRQEIARLRFEHGRTMKEILAHLKEMGAPEVSQTALTRHLRLMKAEMDERVEAELAMLSPHIQLATQLANAMLPQIEAAPNDVKLRALRELLQTLLLRDIKGAVANPDDPDAQLSLKDKFVAARTLQTLAQAERTDDARAREAAKAAKEQAMDAVEKVAKTSSGGGLTADLVMQIRHAVLGDA